MFPSEAFQVGAHIDDAENAEVRFRVLAEIEAVVGFEREGSVLEIAEVKPLPAAKVLVFGDCPDEDRACLFCPSERLVD